MKLIPYLCIIVCLLASPVLAATVTLKTTQDLYTFTAGEEARVPFIVESSFPRTNVGDLSYTLTRKESQGGLSFTQSSTQSQSFPISPGSSQNAITLASTEPTEYEVSLSLHYRDDGKDFSSDLPPFTVRFTSNQTGQSQTGPAGSDQTNNPLTSSTKEIRPDNQGQEQDPFAEMDAQINAMRQQNQQMLQQALASQGMQSGQGMQQQPQTAQQALQNNQMNAQSSALQQQLAQEAEQKKQDQKYLQEQVSHDPLMNQMAKSLNQAGYQQKEGTIDSQGKDEGSLSARFENETGQSIDITGEVKNGSVNQVSAHSDQSLPVPDNVSGSKKYQEETTGLRNTGYNQTGGTQTMTRNETRIEEQYQTSEGKNATVTSIIRNGTLEEVTVKKNESVSPGWYLGFILLLILACLCAWAGYRYYTRRTSVGDTESQVSLEEPLDIREETERKLLLAEQAFSDGNIKNAYAFAGQGLRFYISHRLGTGGAGTNEEIIALLLKSGREDPDIQDILNTCMMVEFARSEGSEEEFRKVISTIRANLRQ